MAARFLDKVTTPSTTDVQNYPDAAGIAYDRTTGSLVYNDAGTLRYVAGDNGGIVSLTASSLTLSPSLHSGRTVVVNAVAGSAITLPAATGSGAKYRVVIGTALTSASVTVGVTGDDIFYGISITEDAGDSTPADATVHPTASNSNLWTDAFTGGGGEIGDYFEAEDIGADKWAVSGVIRSVLDSTVSPFSNV
jgi:hypothetical protein